MIPPYLVFAAVGVALLAGLAGAIVLARFLRRRFRVASAVIEAAGVEHRRSRFEAELQRHGIEPAEHPTGRIAADQVPAAAQRAAWDDTQLLAPVHTPRHAAEREHVLDELAAGGWTRDRLQANAAEGRW